MSTEFFKACVVSQFDAALSMMHECLVKCPDEHWDGIIGKYPFWMVAYHTLCFVDVYASRTDEAWKPQTGPTGMHPNGRQELEDEYPSRRFERAELVGYLKQCRTMISEAMAAETPETLAGPTGFKRRDFSRFELYLYNLRHVQHHTGQLTAFLRRAGVDTRWIGTGWREM